MGPFVLNTRHWPRVPARCHVLVVSGGEHWHAETLDLGPGGCQLVSPRGVPADSEIRLAISAPALQEKLAVAGRITWMSETNPVHMGVAFTKKGQDSADPRTWFVRLLQADPVLAMAVQRIPQQITTDTMFFLAEPPRLVLELTRSKLTILQLIGEGATLDQLLTRHPSGPEEAKRALLALLEIRAVTLSLADAVAPQQWAKVLAQAESLLAQEEPSRPIGRVRPISAERTPSPDATPSPDVPRPVGAPPPLPTAAVRPSNGQRDPSAQVLFVKAREELAAGNVSEAVALLTQAFTLSPRDPEISALLGQIAFKKNRSSNP